MELLFVVLGGLIIGLIARYALPRRSTHGEALIPAVAAIVAAVVWVALTWAGWPWDGGWIWAVSLVASGIVAVAVDILVGRRREEGDRCMLVELGG